MKYFSMWASKEYPLSVRILALFLAGCIFPLLIPYTILVLLPRVDRFFHLPRLYFGIANIIPGCLFICVGVFYAFWSIYLQVAWAQGTPLPMIPTKKLLVNGPFKQCRNPMVFGTVFLYLGLGVLAGSISAVVAVLIFTALLLTYVRLVEERELEMRFAQEYLTYKANTPFFFPALFRKK